MIGRAPRCGFAAAAILLASASGPASAAAWRFEPVVDVRVERTDNVQLDDPRITDGESATILRTGVRLSVERETPRSSWSLAWRPVRETYDGFSQYDNTAHAATLGWSWQASRRASWSLAGTWTRAERARVSLDEGSELIDVIDVGVVRTTTWSGRLQGLLTGGPRNRFVVAADTFGTSYASDAPGFAALDDARTTGAELAWETDLGPRTVGGLSVRASRIDEGRRGEYDTRTVLVGFRFGAVERLQVTLAAGVTATDVRDPGVFAAIDVPNTETGRIVLARRIGARTTLAAGVARSVDSSRGVGGVSVNDRAYLRLSRDLGPRHTIAAAINWTDRDPVEDDPLTGVDRGLRTAGYRLEWAARLGRRWALVLAGDRIDQSAATEGAVPEIDRTIWSLGLRWSPLAPAR